MKAAIFALLVLSISCQYIPKIGVFIESLCPDCQDFTTYSFKPYFNSQYYKKADVEFVPYGNAYEEYNPVTGLWEFDCQHGPNEVKKNIFNI